METDLRPHLDNFDHNKVFSLLNSMGRLSQPVTFGTLMELVNGNGLNPSMEAKTLLDEVERRLGAAQPSVAQPAQSNVTAAKASAQSSARLPTAPTLPNATAPSVKISRQRTDAEMSNDAEVLTTSRVQVNATSTANAFAEQRLSLPTAAPVLLYALITFASIGGLIASGSPASLGFALGLGFAGIVPAIMPPHTVNQILAAFSSIGWLTVLFWLGLDLGVENPSTLGDYLMSTTVFVPLNFLLMAAGVSVLGDPSPDRYWTRRMANNMYVLAVAMLILAGSSDTFGPNAFTGVVGVILGLWGIIVLGQSRPIELRDVPDQAAIVALAFSAMSLSSVWEGNIFLFLMIMVVIIGMAILAPNLEDEIGADWLLLISATAYVWLSFMLTKPYSDTPSSLLIHGCVYATVVTHMELRFRDINRNNTFVKKVLEPRALRGERRIQEIETDIAVLGFKGAGKTSFLGALWLLLDDRITRDLWYGSAKFLHDDRPLGFTTTEIEELLREPMSEYDQKMLLDGHDDKSVLKQYLEHRWAPTTMQSELSEGALPGTHHGFPFVPHAPRPTRRFLERFTAPLVNPDRTKRKIPDATASVSGNLHLTIAFNAELKEKYPTWFGLGSKTEHNTSMVRNRIHSLDVPGEEVQRAVEYMDGLRITSRSVSSLLRSIEVRPEFGAQREAIRYVVEMTAMYEHVMFIIDADEFTSTERNTSSPVGAYLRLADELAHLSGAALKRITVLLNKSDQLLKRSEEGNRVMPNGGLDAWSDLTDRELAYETLEEVVGPAVLSMIRVPIDVYFTCTFGGLIHRGGEGTSQENYVPTYPLVPINVIEPVIRSLMRRR